MRQRVVGEKAEKAAKATCCIARRPQRPKKMGLESAVGELSCVRRPQRQQKMKL